MTRLKYLVALTALISLSLFAVQADDYETRIRAALSDMGLQVERLRPAAELEGYYQVFTQQGVFYISSDATRLIAGKVFAVGRQPVDLTEQGMTGIRQQLVNESQALMISYPAENERYRVTIFTDHTCPYCRQLHEQMERYNALGISVDYLAFPRAGLDSPAARDLLNVWCAQNQNEAMDLAMAGMAVRPRRCDANMADHLSLTRQMGVTGTPAIITPKGGLIGGFLPPERLISELRNGG